MGNKKTDQCSEMFEATAEFLIAKLKSGEATDRDVKNAIDFIKHNQITCAPIQSAPMKELTDYPFKEEDIPDNHLRLLKK